MIISVTPDLALDEGYTYAGGLGVLEGDKFYAAARLKMPYNVLTFLYRQGYVEYEFNVENKPIAKPQFQPQEFLNKLVQNGYLTIKLNGADVKVEIQKYVIGKAEAVFFKPVEPEWASRLSDRIYIWDSDETKFYTYTLLAKTSAEYLRKHVGIANIDYIDLQESYTCILPLVLKIPGKYRLVIHTAGPWGHPSFKRDLFDKEFGFRFITPDIALTNIGLAASREAFAVSAKHYEVLSKIIPHFLEKLHYVTNGVNVERWMDPELKISYEDGHLLLDRFIQIRNNIRKNFLEFIRIYKDVDVSKRLIVTWCRRLVQYKRPEFVIKAIEELPSEDFFFVLAGNAHPHDARGLEYMQLFHKMHIEHENAVYIPNYNFSISKKIIKSADLLLFTPLPGWEACGTSYMKAALNGVPSLASPDGGVAELIIDNVNGWLFGVSDESLDATRSNLTDDINALEYDMFKRRLTEIISIYKKNLERYYKISFNALIMSVARVAVERALRQYYQDIIKIPPNSNTPN